MKKAGLLVAGLLAALSLSVASAAKFSDVPPGHWAEEAVYKLADEGIILGFPDGTYRGNEFLTRYQAALLIYRLLERLRAEFKAGVDEETLAALRNAVQELAAELASLGVRVSALEDNAATKGDVARLQAAIEELKKMKPAGVDMAALKDLEAKVEAAAVAADAAAAKAEAAVAKAEAAMAKAEDAAAAADGARGLAEANADSIKALNELAVMLNQDVLGLQDRVAALEKEVVALKGATPQDYAKASDLKALTEYVQALSGDVAGLAGKLGEVEDRVGTLERNAFTISGSLTLTYDAVDASGFSGYDTDRLFVNTFNNPGGDTDNDGELVDENENLNSQPGNTTAALSVKFQTGKLTGTSAGEGVNTYEELFQFSIKGSWTNPSSGAGYADDDANASAHVIYVDEVSTTLTVAKGQQLEVTFGQTTNAKFTEYVFDNDANSYGPGLVATLKPGFLGATVTFAYGNNGLPGYDYFYAGRVALAPTDSFSVGASYVEQDSLANAVWGVDASAGFGPLSLMAEYFSDATATASYYVKGGASFGAISLDASYRNIAASVTPANLAAADLFVSGKNQAPFAADQNGFGVGASAGFGLFTVGGEYQSYTIAGTPTTYWEATLGVGTNKKDSNGNRLATGLAGFYASAKYSQATGGTTGWKPGQTITSGALAKLQHFADAPDAAVSGLNLTVEYGTQGYERLNAYGDFTAEVGPLSLFALAGYYSQPVAGDSATKYGLKVETDPFAAPLKPKLLGGYVARSSSGPNWLAASESKWFAGIELTEFLFSPHSKFRATYASYSANNVDSFAVGEQDKAFDASTFWLYSDSNAGGGSSGTLTGFELSWTYWDLEATFASYVDNAGSYADAFRIRYKVGF